MTKDKCFKRLFDIEKKKLQTLAKKVGLHTDELHEAIALLLNQVRGRHRLLGQFHEAGKKRTFVLLSDVNPETANELIRTWRRLRALTWYAENLDDSNTKRRTKKRTNKQKDKQPRHGNPSAKR